MAAIVSVKVASKPKARAPFVLPRGSSGAITPALCKLKEGREMSCRGKLRITRGQPMVQMCCGTKLGPQFPVSTPREAQRLIRESCATGCTAPRFGRHRSKRSRR